MSGEKLGIQKDETLEITQVVNGFIVRRAPHKWFIDGHNERVWSGAQIDYLVFRSMAELMSWLGEHFTHRARPVLTDSMPKGVKKN